MGKDIQFIEYIGPEPEKTIEINSRMYTFKPDPMFGGRKVQYVPLNFPKTWVEKHPTFAIYVVNDRENFERAFWIQVFHRREEVKAFIASGKIPQDYFSDLFPVTPEPEPEPEPEGEAKTEGEEEPPEEPPVEPDAPKSKPKGKPKK